MKYNRLLSISISIGILLSVCAIIETSTTSSQAADTNSPTPSPSPTATPTKGPVHDVPITNFVKHNQGLEINSSKKSNKQPHRNTTPWFFAQLVSDDGGKTFYARYLITDQYGIPTDWHSKISDSINEDHGSTLFTTTFDFAKDILVRYRDDGEVEITGTDSQTKKTVTWMSDSNQDGDDGDVSWTQLQ